MTRRIEIQTKTDTFNEYNEPVTTWATTSTIWADVTTTGGGEFYAAQKVNATTSALFKVRAGNTVTVQNRIKYGSRIFEILQVNDVNEAHVELLISAKEVI